MAKKPRTGYNPLDDFLPQIKDTREEKPKGKSKVTSNITSKNTGAATSNNAGKITITKKSYDLVKMTHYFRPDQLKEIARLSKKSGRDKSELVRLAVDVLIEQAKIQ